MEDEIIVPDMPFMRDIFKILKTGAFINEDSQYESNKQYYGIIDKHFNAYFKYFLQLGYYLEKGMGYVHLCESRPVYNVQSKLRTDIGDYIKWLAVLTKFRPELAPGDQFKTYELQQCIDQNDEVRSLLPPSDDGLLPSRISRFLKDVSKEGFIEVSDESVCRVTAAFRYLKEYVLRIKLYGEHEKYNLGKECEPISSTVEVKDDTHETNEPIIEMEG